MNSEERSQGTLTIFFNLKIQINIIVTVAAILSLAFLSSLSDALHMTSQSDHIILANVFVQKTVDKSRIIIHN